MSCCGNGKMVTFELFDNRLVTLDLDCDEDWGDISVRMRGDNPHIEIGNDEDGYVDVRKCWEENDEGQNEDYIDEKFKTFYECDKLDVIEWVLVRMLAFCEGYSLNDLKEALNSYGIDIKKIWIPDFLWDYLTDEEKKELPYIH